MAATSLPRNSRMRLTFEMGVTWSASPPARKVGMFSPAQVSLPGRPLFFRLGHMPHTIRCQTGVLLCLLNRSCSRFVSSSASAPVMRATLLLSMPPLRSHLLKSSNTNVGTRAARPALSCCSLLSGSDCGQIAMRPATCFDNSSACGDVGDANSAAREQPMLWPTRITCWSSLTARWASMTTARRWTSASVV